MAVSKILFLILIQVHMYTRDCDRRDPQRSEAQDPRARATDGSEPPHADAGSSDPLQELSITKSPTNPFKDPLTLEDRQQ